MNTDESKKRLDKSKNRGLKDEKPQINEESVREGEEMFNDPSTEPRHSKLNNFPTSLLILAILQVTSGKTCTKDSDISWISNTSIKIVGCTPCPPCNEGQEYSIPCGTKAYVGTKAACVPCPNGKYSDGFNTKACTSCTLCSNRVVIRNCTSTSNTLCGDCKPGYYFEETVFGCLKCAQCCHDGQDQTHASCSSVHLCKPRPNGCPVVPTTKAPTLSTAHTLTNSHTPLSLPATTPFPTLKGNNQTVKSTRSSGTDPSDSGIIDSAISAVNDSHVKPNPTGSTPNYQQSTQNGFFNVHKVWFIVGIVILCAVVFILIIIAAIQRIKNNKLKKAHNMSRDVEMARLSVADSQKEGEDQTLEEFIHKKYDVVDTLCKLLINKTLGRFDFQCLASKLNISEDDVRAILFELHVQGGSPVRKLLEVLSTQRLCTTVRQLAESVKDINRKAYKVLKPHFLKPNLEA